MLSPGLLVIQVGDLVFNSKHDLVVNIHWILLGLFSLMVAIAFVSILRSRHVHIVLVTHHHSRRALLILLSKDAHVRSIAGVV